MTSRTSPGGAATCMKASCEESTPMPSQLRLASLAYYRFPPITRINARRASVDIISSFRAQSKSPRPEHGRSSNNRNDISTSEEIPTLRGNAGKKGQPPPSRSEDPTLPTLISRPSPNQRKLVRRGNTLSSLSEPQWREARPFLGHRRPKIFDKYKPVKSIGKGQYGTVFEVVERRDEASAEAGDKRTTRRHSLSEMMDNKRSQAYACKVVDLISRGPDADNSTKALQSRTKDIINEIEMMAGPCAGHPNVQNIIDFVVEDDKAYIVSSLCRGGDLAQALEMRGCLCEEDARSVMAGILRGLAHLHARGVAHRDIKLENILLTDSKHDMSKVKIIDMGFAKQLASSNIATPGFEAYNTVCGTPMYIAPEMIRPTVHTGEIQSEARYGTQADMWSAGVILYHLLSGCPPFEATADMASLLDLFKDIEKAEYDFWDPIWETVSEEAMDMIEALLEADPAKRLTAEAALRHPWMTDL